MLTYRKGNLLAQPKGIMVHGCNATKLPAGGIAHHIFTKWPEAEAAHHANVLKWSMNQRGLLGTISTFYATPELIIANAVTQSLPGGGTLSYDAIEKCFALVSDLAFDIKQEYPDTPIIIPKIGAGIAGGNWNIIEKIIDETVHTAHEVVVYVID